jgi:pimeloyl-ACP methyl ester carboxylesterase
MDIDLDLYRHEVRVSSDPLVRLSAIDISPELPERTFVFIHGFGGQAMQWQYPTNRPLATICRASSLTWKLLSIY